MSWSNDFYGMFSAFSNLQTLNFIGHFKKFPINSFDSFINYSSSLQYMDISNLALHTIKCSRSSFSSLDLDLDSCCQWNFINTKNGQSMLSYGKMPSLDVSMWNMSSTQSLYSCFEGCKCSKLIGLQYWHTNNVTNFGGVFSGTNLLHNLQEVEKWNVSAGQYFRQMFGTTYATPHDGCGVIELNLSQWNMQNAIDITSMFSAAENLQRLTGLNNWNLSNINILNLNNIFYHCHNLENIHIILKNLKWNSNKIGSLGGAFYNCQKLNNIEFLQSWNTESCTNFYGTFFNTAINNIQIIENWYTNNVTTTSYMFKNCRQLTNINLTKWNTDNFKSIIEMFNNCQNLINLDVSNWNISQIGALTGVFQECTNLTSLNIKQWNTGNVSNFSYLFHKCNNLISLDLSDWNIVKGSNCYSMFNSCRNLTELNVQNWNSTHTISMAYMFYNCISLTNLNLTSWNFTNINAMTGMFTNCQNLSEIDFPIINFPTAMTFSSVFTNCFNLTTIINIDKWNTSKFNALVGTFNRCYNLASLNLSAWNVQNVTNMSEIFRWCTELDTLNINDWNVSKVTCLNYALSNCTNLKNINLSQWKPSSLTNMTCFLTSSNNLTQDSLNSIYNMFINATNMTSTRKNLNTLNSYSPLSSTIFNQSYIPTDYQTRLTAAGWKF